MRRLRVLRLFIRGLGDPPGHKNREVLRALDSQIRLRFGRVLQTDPQNHFKVVPQVHQTQRLLHVVPEEVRQRSPGRGSQNEHFAQTQPRHFRVELVGEREPETRHRRQKSRATEVFVDADRH